MKKTVLFLVLVITFSTALHAQNLLYPVIKDYGGVADVPFAKDKPDTSLDYKIIVEVAAVLEKPAELYPPLEHIARMYNLHVYAGVPQKNIHLEVVVFGPSVAVLLNNDAYKKKFGTDNPNLKIIEEMKNAGIKIDACGQSVVHTHTDPATINANVDLVVSRFTTVSDRQLKGYAFFLSFDTA